MSPRGQRLLLTLSLGLNLAFAALLAVMIFSPETLFSWTARGSRREEFAEHMLRRALERTGREIDLSREQKEKLESLLDRTFETSRGPASDVRRAERDLLLTVLRAPDDEDAIEQRIEELQSTQERLGRQMLKGLREAVGELTPGQIHLLEAKLIERGASVPGAPASSASDITPE